MSPTQTSPTSSIFWNSGQFVSLSHAPKQCVRVKVQQHGVMVLPAPGFLLHCKSKFRLRYMAARDTFGTSVARIRIPLIQIFDKQGTGSLLVASNPKYTPRSRAIGILLHTRRVEDINQLRVL